jgi:oxygen-independent coproporphyrinogen-3 oxidase
MYGIKEYYKAIDEGKFPIDQGYKMDGDEVLRREVIFRIICDWSVDFKQIESKFGISFGAYFAPELASLAKFEQEGILEFNGESFNLTSTGRFFSRHVAKVFDRFLQKTEGVYQITGP